ncbi:sensor histidine kinase [Flavobacterium tibetense]|jgi:light-regulated signal transduction histidine kinase (bacteriophytochrome)|uniref:histidine kinase n=1 Tax=Flavobacterium tibetense TaxID=2233533 RepID=A0A365NZP6_9FLAO|nr:ATP-binding protein [Flavobacterium tibetense]RBA27672.1 multi-sensor signal transduction histidine kinase [Flavobacterium tibetense]
MKAETKITLIYLLVGFIWILTSDQVVLLFIDKEINSLSYFQTIKGLFYVTTTGLLLYLMLKSHNNKLNQKIKELRIHAKKLEQTNQDLEYFTFIASHDLQEPLRNVTTFLDQLQTKYKSKLDENASKYINFAVGGAKQMRKIILALLDYTKIENLEKDFEIINIKELIEEIIKSKNQIISETNAVINYKELPVIFSNPAFVKEIFNELIDNALKFKKEGVPSVIYIDFENLDTEWKFTIKDNGIGIEESYYEKIFIPFQRLHNKEEFTGTGIGLAIVKRMITNLNGRIWLISDKTVGSVFCFTISKNCQSFYN